MFPIDVVEIVKAGLAEGRRPPDGKLHCSSHLIGSLRHAMLEVAGAPTIDRDFTGDVRLETGTMWHSYIEDLLAEHIKDYQKFASEVQLDEWLPEGWSGKCDWLVWDEDRKCWILGDLKTCKGEAIQWIARDGAKDVHIWQCSAYWYALEKRGVSLLDEFGILYLPMNTVSGQTVEPILCECKPLPKDLVIGRMEERWAQTQEYLDSIQFEQSFTPPLDAYLSDKLAPVQPREQKLAWNGKANVWDLKLTPHYTAAYCPFPDELCDCNTQGVTKIGEYRFDDDLRGQLMYYPRKDYENVEPLLAPTEEDYQRRSAA